MWISGLTRILEDIFRDMESMSSNPIAVSNQCINFFFSNWFHVHVYDFRQAISHVAERNFINAWYWLSQYGPNIQKVITSITNDILIWSS